MGAFSFSVSFHQLVKFLILMKLLILYCLLSINYRMAKRISIKLGRLVSDCRMVRQISILVGLKIPSCWPIQMASLDHLPVIAIWFSGFKRLVQLFHEDVQ